MKRLGASRGWLLIGVLVLVVAGCNRPAADGGPDGMGGLQTWIDAPLHDSTLLLAPVEIVLHAADPGGVAMVELSINGEVLSRRPPDDTSAALVTHRIAWEPAAPGEYDLTARAQNSAGAWSAVATSHVTVVGPEALTEVEPILVITPTPTAADLPAPTPACIDRATFITDVTIPDNTNLPAGQPFTKVWRLRNDGTCPWNEEYKLVFIDGDPMSNPTPLPIAGSVPPGSTVDLSVDLVAPLADGTYRSNYQLRNPQGVLFGVGASGLTPFYVQLIVGRPTPTSPPAPDTQAPSVSVSHTPAGDFVPTTSVITFTAVASDNVGVTRIDLWVTAPGGWPTLVKTCANTTSCSFAGGPYPQGNLSYFAIAADAAGHETNSGGKTITIYVVVSGLPEGHTLGDRPS